MNEENAKIKLTTAEALKLIEELKHRVTKNTLVFPSKGNKLEFEVFGQNDFNKYTINITRSKINKEKCSYQGRTTVNSVPLMRLDITDGSHVNSDGTKIVGNHLHIYSEDVELRDAIPFDVTKPDLYEYCLEFFEKFNIIQDENNGIIYQLEL